MERTRARGIADQHAGMLWLDDGIRAVFNRLEKMGVLDNTLIIFASDNGESQGKMTCYQAAAHLPAFIYWKGKIMPAVSDELTTNLDFLPTFMELSGLDSSECNLDGESWVDMIFDGASLEREALCTEVVYQSSVYLSRETFLTPLSIHTEGTPYGEVLFTVNEGYGRVPEVAERPALPWTPYAKAPIRDNFDGDELDAEWNFLRKNGKEWYELKDGALILDLREEVATEFVTPSLIAKRISHHVFRASTRMTFSTKKDNEQAGLVLYRCSQGHITALKDKESIVITSVVKGHKVEEICRVPCLAKEIILAMESDGENVTFEWAEPDEPFQKIDTKVPLVIIADDHNGGFNGPMVGVYATSNGEKSKSKATFKWFDYSNQ